MYGATVGRVGRLAINATTNQAVCHVMPDPAKADAGYMFHALCAKSSEYVSKATGGAQPNINQNTIRQTEIFLPPLAEQKRIAAILDQADALRRKRKQAIERLNQLGQAIFYEMFGELASRRKLEDVCELITDGTHQTPTYAESGVTFLSAKNVTTGHIDWTSIKFIPEELHLELSRRCAPKINDVLLAKNGTTGVAALVDRNLVFDIYVSLALLRPSANVLPKYLLYAVNSESSKRQFNHSLKGVGVSNLHLIDIRKALIPVAPLEDQLKFVSRIDSVQQLSLNMQIAMDKANKSFQALQSRAFAGTL
jgi:restriction endonuclease S subunit